VIKKDDFLAKSNGQSIEQHTKELLDLFDDFCNKYGDSFDGKTKLSISLAAEYHDLGKINSSFQTYIHQKTNANPAKFKVGLCHYKNIVDKDIPHAILSAAFISKKKLQEMGLDLEDYRVIVTAVVNHHLRSLQNQDTDDTIKAVVNGDLAVLAKYYGLDYCKSIPIIKYNFFKPRSAHDISEDLWLKYAKVKGMLNKLDYAASAHEKSIEILPENAKTMCISAMKRKNFALRPCQQYVRDKGGHNLIMTASTGMGKTEAALIWAEQAKTFYTLPYKVSINAIHQRICDDKYYDKNKCVLLHSDTFSQLLQGATDYNGEPNEGGDIFKEYQAIKNLAYPFTICTVDQLFLFSYLAHGTELVASTLSYSKVIIDEIQAYEPKILAKILRGLVMINKMGGKFLIMTATLPPFIKEYLQEHIQDLEISPAFFNPIIRHIPTLIKDEMNFEKIANTGKSSKVLVICNTVANACNAYKNIKKYNQSNVNLLHSRFIQKDRLEKEKAIKNFAASNENGVWISTQLVEASLDIDFDILFTEMSTADSLLQRMGRCYRGREYNSTQPNIIVFDNKSGTGYGKRSIYDYEIYQRSVDALEKYCNQPFSEKAKQDYIEYVYDTTAIKQTEYYQKFIKEMSFLTTGLLAGEFKIDVAREKFREIENSAVIPFKFLDTAEDIMQKIDALPSTKDKAVLLQKKRFENELKKISLQVNLFNRKRYGIHKDKRFSKAHITILTNGYDNELGLIDSTQEGVIF